MRTGKERLVSKRAMFVIYVVTTLLLVTGALVLQLLGGKTASRVADVLIIVSCLATITTLIGLSFHRARGR